MPLGVIIFVFVLVRAQELCECRGGRPGLPVPNNPYSLCRCKATVNVELLFRGCTSGRV